VCFFSPDIFQSNVQFWKYCIKSIPPFFVALPSGSKGTGSSADKFYTFFNVIFNFVYYFSCIFLCFISVTDPSNMPAVLQGAPSSAPGK